MPRRHILTTPRFAAIFAAAVVLAACGGDLSTEYETDDATLRTCEALYDDAPAEVAGQARRGAAETRALAWGTDAIVMRCGVTAPAGLTRSSRCDVVAEVGWFTEQRDDSLLFTTIGREVFVSVEVPRAYEPAADALVDLADTVVANNEVVTPCV